MKETIISSLNLGSMTNKHSINVSLNRKNKNICKYLFKCGLISSFVLNKQSKKITIYFSNYYNKKPIISVKKVSKPGRKVYISYLHLKKLLIYKKHFLILSTSKGILNNKEAVTKKIGGEFLFFIVC
jgi:ribosomal protein S8